MSGELVKLASDKMKKFVRFVDTVVVKGSKVPVGNKIIWKSSGLSDKSINNLRILFLLTF